MGCALVGMLQPAEGEDYGTMKQLPEKQSKKDSIEEEIIGKEHFILKSLIFIGIVLCFAYLLPLPSPVYRYFFYFILIGYLIDAWYNGTAFRSYGVSSHGLTEYVFGRKKHFWSWSLVQQIGRQQDSIAYDYFGKKHGVIITLHGAPLFDPAKKTGSKAYYHEWRPLVLYVNRADKSIPVLEKYYGKLDY